MTAAIVQPQFASQITNLKYPLTSGQGTLQRGYMQWDTSNLPTGYSTPAQVNFLFNPSTVTATYSLIPDTSVQAAMLFPSANSTNDLRVPLSQTVEWSLLFDRTFELWGSYNIDNGTQQGVTPSAADNNNPSVVGVMVDINAMAQFTGMYASYYNGATTGTTTTTAGSTGVNVTGGGNISNSLYAQQGIMMPCYAYVWFGSAALFYYGYISEWDVTITHWTQYMVPMRCVINVDFTMMPTPNTPTSSTSNADYNLQQINNTNSIIHTSTYTNNRTNIGNL